MLKISSNSLFVVLRGRPAGAAVFGCLLLTILPIALHGQTIFDAPVVGSFAERPLQRQESHIYQLRLEENEFAQVRADQLGVGVSLTAYDPTGNLILRSESRNRVLGFEMVSVIATVAGVYRFEVASVQTAASGAGKYRLQVTAHRASSAADADLLAIEKIFMTAMRDATAGTFESRSAAVVGYAKAAEGLLRHNDAERAGTAFFHLGHTQNLLGERRAAFEGLNRSLQLFRQVKAQHHESVALRFLGDWYARVGDPEKAMELLVESADIARKNSSTDGEAAATQHRADVYVQPGETDTAIRLYEQALRLRELTRGQGINTGYLLLNKVGDVYAAKKDWKRALEYYLKAVEANRRGVGDTVPLNSWWRIGGVYIHLGNIDKALEYLNEGTRREEKIRNPQRLAGLAIGLGQVSLLLGDKAKALAYFRESSAAFHSIIDSAGETFARFLTSRTELELGNLDAAQYEIETALERFELYRSQISNREFKISYFATSQDYHSFYLDILWSQHKKNPIAGFDRKALAATELARARTLAEMLRESNVDLRQGVNPDLLKRERAIQTELNEAAEQQTINRVDASAKGAAKAIEHESRISALTAELSAVQAKIRQGSPGYAELVRPTAAKLDDIQTVLGPDTVLLEYRLGTERSYLWRVDDRSLSLFQLPPRSEIERLASTYNAKISSRSREDQQDAKKLAQELGDLLLGPVAKSLGNKRLLIVADGGLHLIPFAALKARSAVGRSGMIIESNEIISLPSASILPLLRSSGKARPANQKTLAIFADAVFTGRDTRVAMRRGQHSQLPAVLTENSRMNLARLPFSRREAEGIASLIPAQDVLAAFDFAASRDAVLAADLANYRILHFATHGWLDAERPQLSSVVMSLIGKNGERKNGFLRLHEIYNLKLSADLVVLSACQTGIGKNISNEGVIGLTRGFMYAGARRIIASAWNVDDAATAELMRRVYRYLLVDKMSPSAALRAAQLSLSREPRWSNPYFWAAFSIQGDWL
ncbi:MAG: CHAT domain-containing tetratricopeptide repeat protein [Pyrinomonadaceae bacterium]